jgi:UPF0755 protein
MKRWIPAAGGLFFFAALLAVGLVAELDTPTRRSRQGPGRVRVAPGASLRTVAEGLADSGWVRQPRLLAWWAGRAGMDRKVQQGRYRLTRGSSPREVMAQLVSGRVETTRVTIPEGWREEQILKILADSLEIDPMELRAAAGDSAWIRAAGLPRPRLEGYLFPATYVFPKEAEPRAALGRMVREAKARLTPDLCERAARLGIGPDQAVTFASIVQAEAAQIAEMPRIAGVFWRRLHFGWKLEADPTVRYALARFSGPLLYKDLEVDSPYNTYRSRGLPPGPIGNPGMDALRAVLWPDTVGTEMFFVAGGDGGHRFSRTLAEHNRARRAPRASTEDGR